MKTEHSRPTLEPQRLCPDSSGTGDALRLSASTWTFLCRVHPALAEALIRASESDWPYVDVEQLPQASRRYLWGIIRQHSPPLEALFEDRGFIELRSRCQALFQAHLELPLETLVDTLRQASKAPPDRQRSASR